MSASPKYNVGGVLLDRPFKVRRLGHFGFNLDKFEQGLHFYRDLLGFRVSDTVDFAPLLPAGHEIGTDSTIGCFMTHGTDHHSHVIFPKAAFELMAAGANRPNESSAVTTNQISWQVGTLREVGDGIDYFKSVGVMPSRAGRDTPGSNWHSYLLDPDGHTNEIYYGMEQIGWDLRSKPPAAGQRGFHAMPELPQICEYQEIDALRGEGVDLASGNRHLEKGPFRYDVGGVLLPRPFKVAKVGPVRLFVVDIQRSVDWYTHVLGLRITEEIDFHGHRCVFLRCNTEHHSLALYPLDLRDEIGLSPHTTCMSFGNQLGDYRQLRDAVDYLSSEGVEIKYLPPELFPGIDYSAFVLDPDGHTIQLYYYMEQVGWDGRTRADRPHVDTQNWPDVLEPFADTFDGETLLGPLG